MKKKFKNKPKLPKYTYGNETPIASAADQQQIDQQNAFNGYTGNNAGVQNSGIYSTPDTQTQSGNSMWNNPTSYSGMATAGAMGFANEQKIKDDPKAYDIDKAQATLKTQQGIQAAVPVWGQINTAKQMATNAVVPYADKSNSDLSFVGQNILDPAKYIGYASAGIFTPKQYTKALNDKANPAVAATPEVFNKDYRQDAAWQRVNNYNGNQGEFMKYGGMLPPYAQYPMSGMPVNPNAELELQENTMNQNGEFTQYDGPSHEQGGIPTELDPAEMVFSDKLKMGKKTFADLNKANNTSKQDKVLSDPKADRTAKTTAQLIADIKLRKSRELFAAQEQLKQDKVAKYAEKMGVKLPTAGRPTMRNGGKLPQYRWGNNGEWIPDEPVGGPRATFDDGDSNFAADNTELINATNDLGAASLSGRNIPMTAETARSYNPGYKQSGPSDEELAAYNADLVRLGDKNRPTMRTSTPIFEDDSSDYNSMRTRNIMEGISNGVFQNAGNFYDLYQSGFGKKYDKEDFGRIDPSYVRPKTIDATESLRDADRESAASRAALRGAVGGNAGAYMANLSANQTARTLNKARIREGVANTNTGILNNADATNVGIKNNAELTNLNLKNQARMAEQQNKARSEDMAAHAVRDMGSKFASSYKDYKSGEMDEKRMTLINQYFPNYKYNPDTFEMYFNASQSASKTKKKSKSKPTAKSGVGYTAVE